MAETNLELVRQGYEAWNRGDWDGVFALFDAEIEVRPPELWPEAAPVKGRDAVRKAFEGAVETIEDLPWMDVEELREIGDRVLASVRTEGKGRGSGIQMEGSLSQVFQLRGGMIVRIDFYLEPETAREAALENR